MVSLSGARKAIRSALEQNQQEPIIFDDVSPELAQKIADLISSASFEHRYLRFEYDSETLQVNIIMPNSAYEIVHMWMEKMKADWQQLLPEDYDADIISRRSPQPNYCLGPNAATFPSVILEIGNTETYAKLVRDKCLWAQGSGGEVKVVILIEVQRLKDPMAARLELWRGDSFESYVS
ncbi:hypothetical protein ABW21_db0204741 [Orbilia brochopaga]|nr:hypothetical protein ABW21_db0204741 [Drechslerella brochopaga]